MKIEKSLKERILSGDKRSIGRAISAVEDARPEATEVLKDISLIQERRQ